MELEWVEADAEALPFEDGEFDTVISSIGVMFAPQHEAAAGELVRVCRPGGTIGLLGWTADGMIGALFRAIGPFSPAPPPGAQPPQRYGPTIVARANAETDGRADEFDQALSDFCGEWNRGSDEAAHFEMEYLVAVGRKRA